MIDDARPAGARRELPAALADASTSLLRADRTAPPTHSQAEPGRMEEAAGLYGPESVAWRLNREAMLLLGAGPRALLMQIAHPLVAEGVDQHSDFRADPWTRLRDTLQSSFRVVYGSGDMARAEIRRLNVLHRAISGPVEDPVARRLGDDRYSARDPELMLWVHATLVDSTLVGYEEWIEPLTEAERAAYYLETRPVGRAFGIPDDLLPADLDAFRAYMSAMLAPEGPIRVTPTARELALTILHPPPALPVRRGPRKPDSPRADGPGGLRADGPGGPRTGRFDTLLALAEHIPAQLYDWTIWPSFDLLPPRLREEFAIPWTPWRRLVSAWLLEGFRLWRPFIPKTLRWMPQARAADTRVAAAHRAAEAPATADPAAADTARDDPEGPASIRSRRGHTLAR